LSGDLGAPVDRERLHLLLSDLLQQLEGQADPFLDEVLQRHGVRGLRLVGPLTAAGKRFSMAGEELGRLVNSGGPGSDLWLWDLLMAAYPEPTRYSGRARGRATSRPAADRALCLALRELGWAPVEVPPEPLEHLVELPPGFVEVAPEAAEDGLHYSVEETGERLAAAQRGYNEWQTRIANLNRRLSHGADAFLRIDGVRIEWRGDEGVVTCTIPRHLLLAVGQEAVASRFALWVEMVRGERTPDAVGDEPPWVEACEIEIRYTPAPSVGMLEVDPAVAAEVSRRSSDPSSARQRSGLGIDFGPLNRAIAQLRPPPGPRPGGVLEVARLPMCTRTARELEGYLRAWSGREAYLPTAEDVPEGAALIEEGGVRYYVWEDDVPAHARQSSHRTPMASPLPPLLDLAATVSRRTLTACIHPWLVVSLGGQRRIRITPPCPDGVVFVERGRTLDEVRRVLRAWRERPELLRGQELPPVDVPRDIEFEPSGQPRTVTFILGEDDRL
jgi:hypothetical protein